MQDTVGVLQYSFDPNPVFWEFVEQGRGRMKVRVYLAESNKQFLSFLKKKLPFWSSTNPLQSFNSKHLFFAASIDPKCVKSDVMIGCSLNVFLKLQAKWLMAFLNTLCIAIHSNVRKFLPMVITLFTSRNRVTWKVFNSQYLVFKPSKFEMILFAVLKTNLNRGLQLAKSILQLKWGSEQYSLHDRVCVSKTSGKWAKCGVRIENLLEELFKFRKEILRNYYHFISWKIKIINHRILITGKMLNFESLIQNGNQPLF